MEMSSTCFAPFATLPSLPYCVVLLCVSGVVFCTFDIDQTSWVFVVTSQDDTKCSRDQKRQNETLTSHLVTVPYWAAQSPQCGIVTFPYVYSEIVRDQLYQLNVHSSMESDGIHPRFLRDLANVMAGAISFIYERSWESGESLLTGHLPVLFQSKKRHEETPRELQKGFSNLSSCKRNMEKMILSTVERHLKNNTVSRHSQHGFVKGNIL